MYDQFPLNKFQQCRTPFYYYDLNLLEDTLEVIKKESEKYGYIIHYAIKANANDRVLETINKYNLGTDCVSGNEIKKSLSMGFKPEDIVYAGVGKSDEEIRMALKNNIFCFNCESIEELHNINEIAHSLNKKARIAIRINPDVDANTHKYVTTGKAESKFGLTLWEIDEVIFNLRKLDNLEFLGLHFHIGSQINDMEVFKNLCRRINQVQAWFNLNYMPVLHLNVGGGLGVNYLNPDENLIPDFEQFFKVFDTNLDKYPGQKIHFELGRSVVAQCGSLISKVLYIKKGLKTKFAIIDAGMTDLIRPALYQAFHKIENLSSREKVEKYEIVGPVCESADCFGKDIDLPLTQRNDLIAIRSAGAYGEVMASEYNLRKKAEPVYSID